MQTALLTVAFAAVGASALAAPAPAPVPAALITGAPAAHAMIRRADDFDGFFPSNEKETQCLTETYISILLDLPTPTGELRSYMLASGTTADVAAITATEQIDAYCSDTAPALTVPATLTAALAEYTSELSSWQKSFHDEAFSIAADCGGVAPFIQALVATDVAECKEVLNNLAEAATDNDSGAVRETGLMAAAVAVAGVVGVLAIL